MVPHKLHLFWSPSVGSQEGCLRYKHNDFMFTTCCYSRTDGKEADHRSKKTWGRQLSWSNLRGCALLEHRSASDLFILLAMVPGVMFLKRKANYSTTFFSENPSELVFASRKAPTFLTWLSKLLSLHHHSQSHYTTSPHLYMFENALFSAWDIFPLPIYSASPSRPIPIHLPSHLK